MTSTSRRLAALPPQKRGELAGRLGQAARTVAAEPIAVIGLGCRFPGGVTSPEAFWTLLTEGRDVVGDQLTDRWPADRLRGATADPVLRRGGFLDDPAGLDNDFFGISPREAAAMDPQQRMLLEVAWETAEHAGTPPRSLAGSRTGVFLGMYYNEYLQGGLADPEAVDAYTITGGLHSVAAGRLSYVLGLRGPCLSLDTACSSSLAAVHLACQSLRLRESDLAFAGGANLILNPELSLSLHRYGLLSPDGRCKTFDASADGIVRTEGCAMVLLKRLSDALDDGDRILAVLRGSAVNQDGRSNGLTAPSGAAQRDLLADAVARSGTDPATLGFVETHGTGTELGDPIEVEAIASVYGTGEKGGLALGAVKTNLGHTEAAAGVTALMKAVLAVRTGVIPPNLHFRTLNPKIELDGTRLFVPTALTPWPVADGPRIAAASSFGMGGTNAHVIVEEPPVTADQEQPRPEESGPYALLLSGATEQALRANAGRLADRLETTTAPLRDVAHTLAHRRSHESDRLVVTGADRAQLTERLRRAAAGEAAAGTHRGRLTPSAARGAVWVFSGHGSQWTGMGRDLLADPVFGTVVDELAPVFRDEADIDLRAELAGADLDAAGADRIQPLVYALQVGLAAVLRARGAAPAAVLGHSMGEIAAAVVAGALDPADGAGLVLRRSALLSRATGRGAMAAVDLTAEEAERRFGGEEVDVAIRATGSSVVLSGTPEAIEAVLARCQADGVPARKVASDVAFHGRQMNPLAPLLAERAAGLPTREPATAVYGTVHDDPRRTPAYDAAYWAANLGGTVRFADAVAAALDDGHRTFLEIAPHPVLTRPVARIAEERGVPGVTAAGTLRRGEPAAARLLLAASVLHCAGAPVDLDALAPAGRLADLPTYAWQHRHHGPVPGPATASAGAAAAPADRPLPAEWMYRLSWQAAPAPAAGGDPAPAGTRWLLVGDDADGVTGPLAEHLRAAGVTCTRLAPADVPGTDDTALAALLATADHVVHLGGLALPGDLAADPAPVHREVFGLLRIARALAERPGGPGLLHLATRNAQAVDGHPRVQPGGAALWGLGSSLALDYPRVWAGAVDLDDRPAAEAARTLAGELLRARPDAPGHEPQIAHRGPGRHVLRLVPGALPEETIRLADGGAHLLVGASGLLGPRLADRLVAMGARHLVLLSRRGPAPELVERLTADGVKVTPVAADIADADAVERLFARFGADLPPLHGVFNAALSGGYTDTDRLTAEEVGDMLRPKIDGTVLLHRLSLAQPVRHFVLFSSTTALLGSRGLTHYAAANRFQDAFVHARRAQGLPGHVVNWGAWGSWVDSASYGDLMKGSGMRGLDDDIAVRALDHVLAGDQPQHVVAAADWPALTAAYRSRTAIPLLDGIAGAGAAEETAGQVGERIAAAPRDRRRRMLRDHVRSVVATVMGFATARELPTDERFFQIGMDSLMSVQAQARISTDLGCELAPAAVFNHPTVDALTDHLLPLLDAGPAGPADPPPAPPATPPAAAGAATDDMSEDELVQRLTEKLRSLS